MTTLNPNDDADLLCESAEVIAECLGVSIKTAYRYKAGAELPEPARRLLKVRLGDLAGLMGDQWQGFTFGRDGKLYLPGWRGGFDPHQIRAMFFHCHEVRHLECRCSELER